MKTKFSYDPKTKLLALSVLIQKEKRISVPHKLLLWAEKYYQQCVRFETSLDRSQRKAG